MSVVRASVEIDASPKQVWHVVSDPRNLPRWDRRVEAVDGVPPNGLTQGSEYTITLRLMGVRARIRASVLEIEPEEYARVHLSGLLDAVVETWLEPIPGERTLLRHRVDYRFRGGRVGQLAARAVRLLGAGAILRHGTLGQKRQSEDRE